MLLTQDQGMILGPISKLLGYIMEGIFYVINFIGIPNVGLAIILFTIVMYLLLMPLTIKQQKFSKLSAKMNPELQAVQAKYKNKKDNDSMMAMNQETQAVYAKYGVSPTGSCLQMLIQMPILFALYRVINSMPAYVGQIKDAFFPLVDKLIEQAGSAELIKSFTNSAMYSKSFTNELFTSGNLDFMRNVYVDCLNKASTTEWDSIIDKFPTLTADVSKTLTTLNDYNDFFGMNIANSPSFIVKEAIATGAFLMVIGALMIPVLSAVTQWLNVKLMPQPEQGKNEQNPMASSMKTMNMMMPIMSAVFCYTLPAGMGIYWIAGSVVRSIQQVLINKHIDKIDMDALIKKNIEKRNKKLEKAGIDPKKLSTNASISTRNVAPKPAVVQNTMSEEEKKEAVKKATEFYNSGNIKPGSIASKANMVKQYNNKNNK